MVIHDRVDGTGSAEHFSSWPIKFTISERWLGSCFVIPIILALEKLGEGERDLGKENTSVGFTCLDEEDGNRRVF